MAYFYYQRSFDGLFKPVKSPDKPAKRTSEGTKRAIVGMVELPKHHEDLCLDVLSQFYPNPEVEEIPR